MRWIMLIAAAIGCGSGLGSIGYSSSLFQLPLQREFGWTRAQIGAALIGFTITGFLGPFFGHLADRIGGMRVILVSMLLLAASEFSLSLIGSDIWSYYLAFVASLTFGIGTGPVTYTRTILPAFPDVPGFALGVVLAGSGAVSILEPPFLSWVIDTLGWRSGYRGLALITFTLGCAAVAIIRAAARRIRSAESASARRVGRSADADATYFQAVKSWQFRLVTTVFFLITIPAIGVSSNLEGLVIENGVPAGHAAWLISALAISVMVSGFVVGWILDRFPAPRVVSCVCAIAALGAALLLLDLRSFAVTLLGVLCLGVAQGTEIQLMGYMIRRYFGLKAYGALVGTAFLGYSFAMPIGSILYGMDHDRAGNYRLALLGSMGVLCAAAGLAMLLGKRPSIKGDANARMA